VETSLHAFVRSYRTVHYRSVSVQLVSSEYELPFTPNEGHGFIFERFQNLVLKNFRRSWYISTEDLLPFQQRKLDFRLQDATEGELDSS
jgi:hypothetical protein